jgi:hypothetical protein
MSLIEPSQPSEEVAVGTIEWRFGIELEFGISSAKLDEQALENELDKEAYEKIANISRQLMGEVFADAEIAHEVVDVKEHKDSVYTEWMIGPESLTLVPNTSYVPSSPSQTLIIH